MTDRSLAQCPDDLRLLLQLCREGRLYDVEHWIAEGKPLQLAPEAIRKGTRPKTALQVALETGQHSLASLLLKSGYRLELERYAPLDLALQARRWDLFDLLLEWGADDVFDELSKGGKPTNNPRYPGDRSECRMGRSLAADREMTGYRRLISIYPDNQTSS